ncbi:MAG: SPFH domain-containing protein [Peptoniphilaceae bacterium]|nr:SPFH domain-containing protein [Peptoniphilaceae bacterium]
MAIVEIIKYKGSPDVFAWKYPNEELSTWTQLIVNEAQNAVLFKDGKALDVFESGRHTLKTANIPVLNKLINLPFGGRSPFTAEIWYVNKVHVLDVKWGTASPIQIQDPKYAILIPVRSYGQFGLRIRDAKKFLVQLVGTLPLFDRENLVRYFKGLYLTKVKDVISAFLVNRQISIVEINAHIEEISAFLQEKMQPLLEEYGIQLVNFYVNDISVPEEDPAVIKLKNALAKKAEMDIIGYNYQMERSFDTLEGAANNSGGSADFMGAGMGLGMGAAVGGAFGTSMGQVSQALSTSSGEHKNCPVCGKPMPKEQRFCGNCGFDMEKTAASREEYVTCSHCGATCTKSMKFCPECGKSLMSECPQCHAPVSGNSKFCSECGYQLRSE